jgi:hypothetical protein
MERGTPLRQPELEVGLAGDHRLTRRREAVSRLPLADPHDVQSGSYGTAFPSFGEQGTVPHRSEDGQRGTGTVFGAAGDLDHNKRMTRA